MEKLRAGQSRALGGETDVRMRVEMPDGRATLKQRAIEAMAEECCLENGGAVLRVETFR